MSKALPSKRQLQSVPATPHVRKRRLHARAKDTHPKSATARKASRPSPTQARSAGKASTDPASNRSALSESQSTEATRSEVPAREITQERSPALITLQVEEGQTWRWQVYDQHGSVMGQQTKCVDYVNAVEEMLRWITAVESAPWD